MGDDLDLFLLVDHLAQVLDLCELRLILDEALQEPQRLLAIECARTLFLEKVVTVLWKHLWANLLRITSMAAVRRADLILGLHGEVIANSVEVDFLATAAAGLRRPNLTLR